MRTLHFVAILGCLWVAGLVDLAYAQQVAWKQNAAQALARGQDWLRRQQQADGSFANPANPAAAQEHPALSALPLLALQGQQSDEALNRGYAYLRSKVQPDGGIYTKGLSNYNTSVCLTALLAARAPGDASLLARARAFVAGQQASTLERAELNGGFGYGPTGSSPKRQHLDLDNTLVALEALAAYRASVPAIEEAEPPEFDYKAAIAFVTRCQNLPPQNPMPWASGDADNRGGFVYYPGFSNAGEQPLEGGGKALRSYGTMSYAGLLSFIYAKVDRQDERVQAVLDWLTRHYTLEENPGMGRQGLYYYYHLLAKALTAAKVDQLTRVGGQSVDWREALVGKLVALQQPDGHWINDTGRWMETNPVLVTAYCTLALRQLLEPR